MSDGRIFDSVNSIALHVQAMGRRCTRYRVSQAIANGSLKHRRGGGYTQTTIERWAVANCALQIDGSSAADAPVGPAVEDAPGAAEERLRADTELKRAHAERAAFRLQQERGEWVRTDVLHAELGARAKAFKIGLEKFGHDAVESIAAIFGAEAGAARDLAAALGLPEDAAARIMDWSLERGPAFLRLWQERVDDLLDAYATGRIWTEEMREAVEKFSSETEV